MSSKAYVCVQYPIDYYFHFGIKSFNSISLIQSVNIRVLIYVNIDSELRKLDLEHKGISKKYRPVNIIDEHMDKKSELYGPLMRHGAHPKLWHQIIDERLAKYKAQFIGESLSIFLLFP